MGAVPMYMYKYSQQPNWLPITNNCQLQLPIKNAIKSPKSQKKNR